MDLETIQSVWSKMNIWAKKFETGIAISESISHPKKIGIIDWYWLSSISQSLTRPNTAKLYNLGVHVVNPELVNAYLDNTAKVTTYKLPIKFSKLVFSGSLDVIDNIRRYDPVKDEHKEDGSFKASFEFRSTYIAGQFQIPAVWSDSRLSYHPAEINTNSDIEYKYIWEHEWPHRTPTTYTSIKDFRMVTLFDDKNYLENILLPGILTNFIQEISNYQS